MQDFDFLILVGGTAGASAAAALSSRASVILLEREPDLAYHDTGRSVALLVETYGPKLIQALPRASRTFFTRESGLFGAARQGGNGIQTAPAMAERAPARLWASGCQPRLRLWVLAKPRWRPGGAMSSMPIE